MTPSLEAKDILRNARRALNHARMHLKDLRESRENDRRVAALHALVTEGRSVTFILQKLRGRAPGFNEWYEPEENAMRADPLLVYFKDLRNSIEKQGLNQAGVGIQIKEFVWPRDVPPAPPGAKSFFMGDPEGRSGWIVQRSDGTEEHVYVDIPEHALRSETLLRDLPDTHRGRPIRDHTAAGVCKLYLDYLEHLLERAEHRFRFGFDHS